MGTCLSHACRENIDGPSGTLKHEGEFSNLGEHQSRSQGNRHFITERYHANSGRQHFNREHGEHDRSYHEKIAEKEAHIEQHADRDKECRAEEGL